MTPEEMRIALVDACPEIFRWNETRRRVEWIDTDEETDPLADLNAMHSAKKALPKDRVGDYHDCLYKICGGLSNTIESTAAQRAEAFCRTLWPERFK